MKPTTLLSNLGLTGFFIAFSLQTAFSLESDQQQPISIKANQAQLQEAQGLAIYSGDVELIQGSLKILCDELIVSDDTLGAESIKAIGQPAYFEQKITPEEPLLKASARQIIYRLTDDQVLLKTQAKVIQGDNTFEGNLIEYDLKTQQLKASSPPETSSNSPKKETPKKSKQRVKMILQPRPKEPS